MFRKDPNETSPPFRERMEPISINGTFASVQAHAVRLWQQARAELSPRMAGCDDPNGVRYAKREEEEQLDAIAHRFGWSTYQLRPIIRRFVTLVSVPPGEGERERRHAELFARLRELQEETELLELAMRALDTKERPASPAGVTEYPVPQE